MLPLALLLASVTPVRSDHPKTFLLSLGSIPISRDEMIESFVFSTWGVTFKSVCNIPPGWTIKAGGSLTPEGTFEGYGSLGVSMPRASSPKEFRSMVLVELDGPILRHDHRDEPATFKGSAKAWADDVERKIPLNYKNIRLVPAQRCPA